MSCLRGSRLGHLRLLRGAGCPCGSIRAPMSAMSWPGLRHSCRRWYACHIVLSAQSTWPAEIVLWLVASPSPCSGAFISRSGASRGAVISQTGRTRRPSGDACLDKQHVRWETIQREEVGLSWRKRGEARRQKFSAGGKGGECMLHHCRNEPKVKAPPPFRSFHASSPATAVLPSALSPVHLHSIVALNDNHHQAGWTPIPWRVAQVSALAFPCWL